MSEAVAEGPGLTLVRTPPPEVVQGEVVHSEVVDDLPHGTLAMLREEMRAAVADIEFRLAQTYEIQARVASGQIDRIYAEDIVDMKHRLTGYTITANSPGAGSIAWASLHIVYMGVDYTITDGNTALKYTYFVKPGSGTSATLVSSNTLPVLGAGDALIFINNGGVPTSAPETTLPAAVAPNTVTNASIVDGAVSAAKTDFYTTLANGLTAAQTAAANAQATADGSITTYFQANAPWANGTSPGVAKIGDVWYDSDDGQAYRWSGEGGTWVAINDSDMGAALTAANNAQTTANSKITTFYAAAAAVPTALAVGDLWVVTDQGNLIKRATATGTASWVNIQFGDAAISGIGGGKVGSGIDGGNVTVGTIVAARVGSGVNGAVLTTATGTVGNSQIGTNAITPAKMNTNFHLLY